MSLTHPYAIKAIPDGVTDNTAAFNSAVAYANANPGTVITGAPGTYVLGLTDPITADNTTFLLEGITFLSKPNTLIINTAMITINADNFQMVGGIFDGNQYNYAAGSGCQLFTLTGSGHKLDRCKFINSPGRGALLYCNESDFIACNFDNNANLGHESNAATYLNFVSCSWNVNGCGFQKTRTVPRDSNHDFAAFGHAFRYRSHHVNLISCESKLNGRDGYFLGEGCYAFKYHACLAWANDDGGFTTNTDPLNPGIPGDNEPCYDITYVDCESYNNWSSGLVTTSPAANIYVIGGRWYNNNRLAGSAPYQSAYYNGIYIAGGSIGIEINCKAYDDRQFCLIAAVNNASLPASITVDATGWVTGTYDYYPKIAIYSATGTFKGYALLVAETVGSTNVTFSSFLDYPGTSSLMYNAVSTTAGGVVVGDYITQRVQHNGLLTDNGCQGQVHVDGYNFRVGPVGDALSGKQFISAAFSNEQNIIPVGYHLLDQELLINPTFDTDILNWTFSFPSGGGAAQETGALRRSIGGLVMVGGAGPGSGDSSLLSDTALYVQGAFVRFSIWAWSDTVNAAYITLFWELSSSYYGTTAYHPGTSEWVNLEVSAQTVPTSAAVIARVNVAAGATVYYDTATLKVVDVPLNPGPSSRYLPV